jgi:hypothetical protein
MHMPNVDYSKTVVEIFEETTLAYMTSSGKLDILCFPTRRNIHDLPSWVPDWTASTEQPSYLDERLCFGACYSFLRLMGATLFSELPDICASGNTAILLPLQSVNGLLDIEALDIDSIDITGMPMPSRHELLEACNEHKEALLSWIAIATTNRGTLFSTQQWSAQLARVLLDKRLQWVAEQPLAKIQTDFEKLSKDFPNSERTSLSLDHLFLLDDLAGNLFGQKVFKSRHGFLGVCNIRGEVGDRIVLARGCSIPLVIRQREDGYFTLVSPAYVDGTMYGELWPGYSPAPEVEEMHREAGIVEFVQEQRERISKECALQRYTLA